MYTIHIEKELDMPIEKAFEAITDHENYHLYAGIDSSVLLRSGKDTKNGVGAIREIKSGGMTIQEEITSYASPNLMEYRIISAKPFDMAHKIGQIKLMQKGHKTHVTWHSEYGFKTPLLGSLLTKLSSKRFTKALASLLRGMEKRYIFFSRK